MKPSERVLLPLFAISIVVMAMQRGGLPVLTPIDSPFPADGAWLLVAAESGDYSGAEMAASAESLRTAPGLNRRVVDYDQDVTDEPWRAAFARATERGLGKPYYLARNGSRSSEGPLAGSPDQMLATMLDALGVAR